MDLYQDHRLHEIGALRWALRRLSLPEYRYCRRKSDEDAKDQVLESKKIEQLFSGDDGERMKSEVKAILGEMGHRFRTYAVRGLGSLVRELVIGRLFEHLYVNRGGMEKIRSVIPDAPVLLLPTHRSYADFLFVSYLCYCYDVTIPIIAAGEDFRSMGFVNKILRRCGAFFIRRTINPSMHPYFTVFVEYAKALLKNGDQPIEFYLEGTRSRTGKSLHPKLGLFRALCDVYFNCEVPDIYICPISITYESPLEEGLLLWEILGIPKPKESTRGLWKARKVLGENHGRAFFYASTPRRLSELVGDGIDRKQHALKPRTEFTSLKSELECVNRISYDIISEQQRNMVMYPSVLVATILLQNLNRELTKDALADQFDMLKRLLEARQANVSWEGSSHACVERGLTFLSDAVIQRGATVIASFPYFEYPVDLGRIPLPRECPRLSKERADSILVAAVNGIKLMYHKNQLLHLLGWDAMLCLVLLASKGSISRDQFKRDVFLLVQLLAKDMVFMWERWEQYFHSSLRRLIDDGVIVVSYEKLSLEPTRNAIGSFLASIVRPSLIAAWLLCVWLLDRQTSIEIGVNEVGEQVQNYALRLIQQGLLPYPQTLSRELLRNVLAALSSDALPESPLVIHKRRKTVKVVNKDVLVSIQQRLGALLSCSCPSIDRTSFRPKL